MLNKDTVDAVRGKIIAAIAEPLGVFTGIDDSDFDDGVVLGALLAAKDNAMSDNDLRKVWEWALKIRIDARALYFMLSGAVLVRVRDGEVEFCRPNESPDEVGN